MLEYRLDLWVSNLYVKSIVVKVVKKSKINIEFKYQDIIEKYYDQEPINKISNFMRYKNVILYFLLFLKSHEISSQTNGKSRE